MWYLGLPACYFKQFKFICAVLYLFRKHCSLKSSITSGSFTFSAPPLTMIPGPRERKVIGFSLIIKYSEVSHCLVCGPLWVSVLITMSDDSWEMHWFFITFVVDFECFFKYSIKFQACQTTQWDSISRREVC